MKKLAVLLAVVLLASCAAAPADQPLPPVWGAGRVTADVTCGEPLQSCDTSEAPVTSVTADASDTSDTTDLPNVEEGEDTLPSQGEYLPAVFMYHLILEEPYSVYESLFVRPSELEAHIGVLDSLGYDYAFAEEYGKKDRPTAILTFDDGYEDNYTEMFPILKRTGAKATVFLVKSLVGTAGYLTEDQIREMSRSGLVSFQSHTANHVELAALSAEQIKKELTLSVEYIESLTGKKVTALAYPAGRYSDAAVAEVGKYITFAYTTESPNSAKGDSPLLIPRFRVSRGCSAAAFRGMAESIKP